MDSFMVLPDKAIPNADIVSAEFHSMGVKNFQDACRYVHELPYGYNSDRDDLMILFKEKMGTCTTRPDSSVAGFLAPDWVSPAKPGSVSTTRSSTTTSTPRTPRRSRASTRSPM